jgi:hypothetical protein
MRRAGLCAFAMVLVLAFMTSSASAADRNIEGTLSGAGGFRFTGCGLVTVIGDGTFNAMGLGPGTYSFRVCVLSLNFPLATVDGTATLTTLGDAALTGTVNGTIDVSHGPRFDFTITGGTKQFTSAKGTITVGPLMQSDFTNCNPEFGICFDWHDAGPLTATITEGAAA